MKKQQAAALAYRITMNNLFVGCTLLHCTPRFMLYATAHGAFARLSDVHAFACHAYRLCAFHVAVVVSPPLPHFRFITFALRLSFVVR
jgi:hypothetical protein